MEGLHTVIVPVGDVYLIAIDSNTGRSLKFPRFRTDEPTDPNLRPKPPVRWNTCTRLLSKSVTYANLMLKPYGDISAFAH
jgi:hypothetical protein